MDELQQLFALMGVTSYAEAVAALTAFNTTLSAEQATLATKGTSATLSALAGRSALLTAVEKATGKTGDEAVGLVRAALTSHTELPKLQERIAELEKGEQTHALAALFAKADEEKRLTPAIKQSVQAAFDAGEITLKGAESWLANSVPVKAFEQRTEAPAGNTPGSVPALHNGKKWSELTGVERADLKKTNPDLYAAMRASAA